MNILHINNNTTWRGGEKQVQFLFTFPSKEYIKFLFCPEESQLYKKNAHNKNVFHYKRGFIYSFFTALFLKNVCVVHNIELIHIHDSHSLTHYILARFFGLKTPAIIHRHVNFKIRSFWKYRFSGILKIICVSNVVKYNFVEKVDKNKLITIHPGIEIRDKQEYLYNSDIRKEFGISENIKIIGTVSALEKEKNIEEFIVVAKSLLKRNRNLFFLIFGEGRERSKIDALIQKEAIKENVLLVGYRTDISSILKQLNVFLFTSKEEGFPMVLLEAMLAKVPIISSASGGIVNMINAGYNALLYTSGKPKEATDLIESLLVNDKLKDSLTENGFNYVQQFDVTLMNKKMEEVYKEILTI